MLSVLWASDGKTPLTPLAVFGSSPALCCVLSCVRACLLCVWSAAAERVNHAESVAVGVDSDESDSRLHRHVHHVLQESARLYADALAAYINIVNTVHMMRCRQPA